MAKKPKTTAPTPVESIKHKDARVNIPTEELRGFVATEEGRPDKLLYPRDPSLDPQLVWKGKDEQDSKPLEMPVVPICIHGKSTSTASRTSRGHGRMWMTAWRFAKATRNLDAATLVSEP